MSRSNPVQEIIQSHQFAPGHVVVEWISPSNGEWLDASVIQTRWRRPPRKPGPHLVAPGAQLLIMMGSQGAEFSFSKAVFVRHHKHWRFLVDTGPKTDGFLSGKGEVELTSRLDRRDEPMFRALLAYTVQEAKRNSLPSQTR